MSGAGDGLVRDGGPKVDFQLSTPLPRCYSTAILGGRDNGPPTPDALSQ